MGDGIENQAVVIAHMGGAVGASLKIGRSREHSEIEPMSIAEPSVGRFDCFEPFLVADGSSPQNLPVEERAECTNPRVVSESRESFPNQTHIGFRDAHVQSAALIHCGNTSLQPTGGSKIGVDRNYAGIAGDNLH